jgi:hypothetical protein
MKLEVYLAMYDFSKSMGRKGPIKSGYKPAIHISSSNWSHQKLKINKDKEFGICVVNFPKKDFELYPNHGHDAELTIITPELFTHLIEGQTIELFEGLRQVAFAVIKKIK